VSRASKDRGTPSRSRDGDPDGRPPHHDEYSHGERHLDRASGAVLRGTSGDDLRNAP